MPRGRYVHEGHDGCRSGFRRLWVHAGISRGEADAGREGDADLRRHDTDSAGDYCKGVEEGVRSNSGCDIEACAGKKLPSSTPNFANVSFRLSANSKKSSPLRR